MLEEMVDAEGGEVEGSLRLKKILVTPVSENDTKVSRVRIPCQLNNALLKHNHHLFIIFLRLSLKMLILVI